MRSSFPFAVVSGLVACFYIWLSYASGPESMRSANLVGNMMAGALLYGSLAVAAVLSLGCKTTEQVASLPWILLAAIFLSTGLMVILGYNMAGGLVGLVNLVMSWVLGIRVLLIFNKK